jgi:glycosyltransferase involved in cell wall biosynthesis
LVADLKLDESPHRDIQPWNVVLQGDGVTLIDADDPTHAFAYDDRKYQARLVALLEAGTGHARNGEAANRARSELSLPVRWRAPLYNPSGYASEALQFILPLGERVELGVMHDNNLRSEAFVAGLPIDQRNRLEELEGRFASASGGITVWHNPANGFGFDPDAAWNVGRTMFETDRIPGPWVGSCNRMDEVWVPSQFNVETFASSGVCRDKLRVMPGAVDDRLFNPDRHEPMALAGRAGFNFLAMFEWSARKGWDVMLSAYLREFSAEDDVCLHLRTYLFSRPDEGGEETLWRRIREFGSSLGLGDKPWPRIELITQQIGLDALPGLYRAMDCLVAPSRGEGWGRPQHEAMLMELPVIGTNWSGNTEFMNERNSYLLEYALETIGMVEPELWQYRGHRWANPSEGHLRQLMRHVEQHRDEARAVGRRARIEMRNAFSPERVAERVLERLREINRGLNTPACPAVLARKLMVAVESPDHQPAKVEAVWEGSYLDHGSLSSVNRELTRRLDGREGLRLTRVSSAAASDGFRNDPAYQSVARRLAEEAPAQSRLTIRHGWPPSWRRPASGAWVLMQPWEFGAIPADWVRRLDAVDEIWVYSRHVWQTYVDSGVDPRKVRVVPLGVSADRFRPGVKPMGLATRKKFKFLYVGGSIRRKGVDRLVAGYLRAFTADDDDCLVIKEFGTDGVYAGKTIEGPIEAAQAQAGAAEILRMTAPIPTEAMPGLYAACDCLVHPYRGEGFGLTVLEAMACGLPVIVTAGGATDDFATDEFAYRVPSRRVSIGGTVDGLALARNGWLLEPDLEALTGRLREVFEHRGESRAKGLAASRYVREYWSWERSAAVAGQRIKNLVAR